MTSFIAESAVEEVCLDFFAELGWTEEMVWGQ